MAVEKGHNVKIPLKKEHRGLKGKKLRKVLPEYGNYHEQRCAEWLYKCGHRVVLLDESKIVPGTKADKCAAIDMELDGIKMDIKTIMDAESYSWSLTNKNKQLYKYNNRPDISEPASSVCLYFPNPARFSEIELFKAISNHMVWIRGLGHEQILKTIYVVRRGHKETLKYSVVRHLPVKI